MAELTQRSRRILYATITEYIASGEPVGSRRLARRYGINLSPATIRNVLADLEEMGYVAQPHTSAGRIPTVQGFRIFVEALVRMRDVAPEDRTAVLERLRNLDPGTDIQREAGQLLSTLTGAAVVVTSPKPEEELLRQLRFLRLDDSRMLAVLVTQGGAVQNRVLPAPAELQPAELERVNNLVAELLESPQSLVAIQGMVAERHDRERGAIEELRQRAAEVLGKTIEQKAAPQVLIEGQERLFDRPEFLDADKIRQFLRAFDDRARLLAMLDETLASGGVRVLIGSEANLADVEDVTVISTSYSQDGSSKGTLGVIGPTRLDYAKVVPLVGFTARVMSEVLGGTDEEV
ncbi:MAG: heat-inducible transcription repressor HrcA [Deltaproteobacteria bacterium]|nr:heat-inducible transcription repressor HrcA [Deltaproteobacteria bacterium]